MTTFLRRKAAAVTFGVLALTLAGGGIAAAAQPATRAPAEVVQPGARGAQPPVSAESARLSKATMTKAATATTLAGITSFTVVNANGTKARGAGIVIKYGVGQYEVQYGHVVTAGAYVATIGRADSCCIPPGGEISVAPRLLTPNGVFIQTRNSAGAPADLGFHLIVHT